MIMLIALFWLFCANSIHRVAADCVWNKSTENPAAVSGEALTVCVIVEEDSFFTSFERLAPAVDLALMHVNAYILLKSVKLQAIYLNSGLSCSKTQFSVTSNIMKSLQTGTTCNMFLGAGFKEIRPWSEAPFLMITAVNSINVAPTPDQIPRMCQPIITRGCSSTAAALYGLADNLNIPLFGCPAAGVSALALDVDNDYFSLLLRPSFGFIDLGEFFLEFFQVYNYTDVTVLRDDTYNLFKLLSQTVLRTFRVHNQLVFDSAQEVAFTSKVTNTESYQRMLMDANDHSRVVIILSHASIVRTIMLIASGLGFTKGSHVFFALDLYDLDYWGKIEFSVGDSSDSIAKEAFRSLLVVSFHEEKRPFMYQFEDRLKQLALNSYNYTFNALETVDIVILSYYESIVMYAQEVKLMLHEGLDIANGTLMTERIRKSKYSSPIGTISISEDGVRDKFYEVKQFDPEKGKFEVILWTEQSHIRNVTCQQTFRFIQNVSWPNNLPGKLPPNEPFCGFRDDKCRDIRLAKEVLTTAIVVPLLFLVAVATAGTFAFIKLRRMRHDYNPDWWKINTEEELTIKQQRNSSGSKRTLNSRSVSNAFSGHSSYVCDILATYQGVFVALTDVSNPKKNPTPEIIAQLTLLKGVTHVNLQRFIGIGLDNSGSCEYVVAELCSKGSLTDILDNDLIKLDWSFKNSLIKDIVLGMAHLHMSTLVSHGNLCSHICLIDTRFQLKISDYGLAFFRKPVELQPAKPAADPPERNYEALLWRAPELLRQLMPPQGTQKGDVYSFAIILQQIILRSTPFELPTDPLELSEREIILEVISANIPPVRPRVPRATCSNELYDLMERCWEEVPLERPTFPKIKDRLRKVIGDVGDNIVDLLFKRMEQYATDLEIKVAEKTQQFMDEKNRSEQLLNQLLPKPVAAALTRGEHIDPEAYETVTIFFSDIVGFTLISATGTPMDVINLLNNLYTFFDVILAKYDVYKVETIGDAYMVSSGLPVRNGNKHAAEIARMSIELIKSIRTFGVPNRPQEFLQIRIGINSGPCVAGIVGISMPRYCLFGDTVNVASRMESTGEPMKIQITKSTKDLLMDIGGFHSSERGEVMVKGKGVLVTHWLLE